MFRKIVSNLAFSPALVGQLGFYAKRLRKEEATRRVGLVFTALALVVQSFAVFSPPEAANASSGNDMISGGYSNISTYLANYDRNTNNIKDLFTSLGISRQNIASAREGEINSKGGYYSWGLQHRFSAAQGEGTYTVKTASGGTRTFYYRPLTLSDTKSYTIKHGSTYKAHIGTTSDGRYFALLQICGNLVLKVVPPAPKCPTGTQGEYPNCEKPKCPIPGKENLPPDSPDCKQNPVAKCESLKITKLLDTYQFSSTASVQNRATVTGYVYTVKKNGTVVHTRNITSTQTTDTQTYQQKEQGTYTVELTVKTSTGNQTGPDCVKTFTIPAPEMCPQNPSLPKNSPDCQPCPGDSTLWVKDEKCAASVVNSKTAINQTQGAVDATKTTAKAGDKIVYTLTAENKGKDTADVSITENLNDVIEYAEVLDAGGGVYNKETKTLTWPTFKLEPGKTQTRMFTIKIADSIPAMGTGVSDPTSYDCRIDNTFGNTVSINIDCPVQKVVVERTVSELPHTGPRENMIFAGILFAVVAYFYMRSRQVKKEVRLIRRDLNTGTI